MKKMVIPVITEILGTAPKNIYKILDEKIETPGGNRSLVKNITAQHIILSSIVKTNKNEPVDNGNNI